MKVDNVKLIVELFVNNIKYMEELSPFFTNQVVNKWKCYTHNYDTTKGDRALKVIKNTLNKLDILENKKNLDIEKIKKENIDYINACYSNKKYKNYLINKINKVNSLCELYNLILKEYDKNNFKINVKMNNTKARGIHYIKDNDGYIYADMYYSNKIMMFSSRSFNYENKLFDDCLLNDNDLVFDTIDGALSVFERKRRIYIFKMFELCRCLNNIKNKKFDIVFPINDYYKCASMIVSSLYEEIFDNRSACSTLDFLRNKTIEAYGCGKALAIYEDDYWQLMTAIDSLSRDILEEYVNIANQEKFKKENIEFVGIENLIPSLVDIYVAFNKLIIKNISSNYDYYMENLEERINISLKYMSISEIVEFNNCFKKVLRKHNAKIFDYKLTQKIIVSLIVKRNDMDALEVINKVLKEDVLI